MANSKNNPEHPSFDFEIGHEFEDAAHDVSPQEWDLGNSALRGMIDKASEARKPQLDKWSGIEKTGLKPISKEQITRFESYVKEDALKGSFRFENSIKKRAAKLARGADDITEDIREVYQYSGIGRDKKDKVYESKRDEVIVGKERKKVVQSLDQSLVEIETNTTPLNTLINDVIPGFIKIDGKIGQLRTPVLPVLSKSQGESLASNLGEETLPVLSHGFYQVLTLSSYPPIPSERAAELTLADALESHDYSLLWTAVLGARTYFGVMYRTISDMKKEANNLSARQVTDEAKGRQVQRWNEKRAGPTRDESAGRSISMDELVKEPKPSTYRGEVPYEFDTQDTLWDVSKHKQEEKEMENQNKTDDDENPFEGFSKNAEASKEMSDKKADELRKQAELDARSSEQTKRTDNLG